MTFLSAAEAVLKSTRRPMSTREITEAALGRGLIRSNGKTPDATMGAALYMAIKRSPDGGLRVERRLGPAGLRAAPDTVRWSWRGQ